MFRSACREVSNAFLKCDDHRNLNFTVSLQGFYIAFNDQYLFLLKLYL
jgi:hypothetical protein